MSEEQLVQWIASVVVTLATSYALSGLVDKKTAAVISPVVLAAARAYLVPRVVASLR
jgi:hypothetical protein